jgi:hypothetical protein
MRRLRKDCKFMLLYSSGSLKGASNMDPDARCADSIKGGVVGVAGISKISPGDSETEVLN